MSLITKAEIIIYSLGTLLMGFLAPYMSKAMDNGMRALFEFYHQPYSPNPLSSLDWYWYYIIALGGSVSAWGIREFNGRREQKHLEADKAKFSTEWEEQS